MIGLAWYWWMLFGSLGVIILILGGSLVISLIMALMFLLRK